METTVIVALVTAIAAIISPVVTSIINNHNSIKMREMETESERVKNIDLHEREVIEKALSGIGLLMSYKDADSIKDACKNILIAVAYVDAETGDKMRRIVYAAIDRDSLITIEEYADICNSLKKEIETRKG